MGSWQHNPDADWRNDGWSLVGSGSALWQILDDDNDSDYLKSPGYRGEAVVRFPVDITAVPAGAVIISVTIQVRAWLGTGTPDSDDSPSVTVDLTSFDNMSRRLSRTINNITSTPTTYTVGTWKTDPTGQPWDIQRVNQIMLRLYSYEGISDLVRVGQLFCVLNYRVAPSVVITSPTGTVFTPSPTISWTYSQPDGDRQDRSQYRIFSATQQALIGFDPNQTQPLFEAEVPGDSATVVLPTSLDVGDYWVYIRAWSSYEAFSPWTGRQFSVNGPSPGIPGVPPTDNNEVNGVGEILTIIDGSEGSATLTVQDTSNMLSVQDADAETITDGTTIIGTNAVSPPARNTQFVYPGSGGSWQMKSLAAGDMTHTLDWVEIAPSQPLTATAQLLAGNVSSRNVVIGIQFYDEFFNSLQGAVVSTPVATSGSTWTQAMVTGTSPSNAYYARMYYTVQATAAANETHYVDQIGLMYGTGTPWSDGGHMSRNLLSSWYSTAEGSPQAGEAWSGALGTFASTASAVGTGASGSTCFSMTYTGVAGSIGWRGAGTVFTSPTSGADFTLNKPTGAVAGDLMIAVIRASAGGLTVTPPVGWTLVDSASTSGDSVSDVSLFVLKRTAGSSEPTSWTDGSLSGNASLRSATVVAYSGAADASQQFIGEASASTTSDSPDYLTTPTVNNTDPNAWRVSAFAVMDDASGGSIAANVQAPTIPPIAFVGRSSAWSSTSANSNSFTINRPTNVQQGDFLYATLALGGTNATVNVPSGWTLQATQNGGSHVMIAVMWKFAGASEPSSWSGTISGTSWGSSQTKITECNAYRYVNATPFGATHSGSRGSDSTESTGTGVNNTNSLAWFVSSWAVEESDNTVQGWSNLTTPAVIRSDDAAGVNTSSVHDGVELTTYDSSGPVSTGNWSLSANYGSSFSGACEFIAILQPLTSPPASVGNDTQRSSSNIGVNPILYGGAFDSNGAVASGAQSITGIFSPGDSDSQMVAAAGWIGLIRPSAGAQAGYAQATMATTVDISNIDPTVITQAGGQCAATAIFSGAAAGTPYITVNFYRANQFLDKAVVQGTPFSPGSWAKSSGVFAIPEGTTRMSLTMAVADRAIGDVSYFDRVSLALGNERVYRPGTSRAAHPVWALPVLEYTVDTGDGYQAFSPIPGSTVANPTSFDAYTGLSTYVDHTVKPLTKRKYRAKTLSYGLNGDKFVSPYGPESDEFQYVAQFWWLKDIANPDNNIPLSVAWDTVSVGTTNTAVVYQALGEDKPVVLTEGFKSESFTITIRPLQHKDWRNLMALLTAGRTMFLQSDIDQSWWVRLLGDIQTDWMPTDARKTNPLRAVKVTFIEVDEEP